jgi:hypothetical protein
MEAAPLARRALDRLLGRTALSGTHERGPDGFLLAYGTNAASGTFARGSIVDVAPTVLYYLGLRVGRDMDGFARTDLFVTSFTRDRPPMWQRTNGNVWRSVRCPPRLCDTRHADRQITRSPDALRFQIPDSQIYRPARCDIVMVAL